MELLHAVAFCLSLPETHEEPHFEARSFRIGRKIFATVPPDEEHLHVFVEPDVVHAAVAAAPDAFEPLMWGKQLAGVRVRLGRADPDTVRDLLVKAWRRRAPKRVSARFDERHGDAD